MGKQAAIIMPGVAKILDTMGKQIKLARLRRKLPATLIAERAGVSRTTVWAVEKGSPAVSMGAYAAVLHAIGGMDKELLNICANDPLGRLMQDMDLPIRKRAPKRSED